jgi:N-acetylglucosaminyldiphosphoundecaprenol N-acetyl-beta-D-mannosaminyltransferase
MAEAAAAITARAADHTQPASYVVKPYVEFLDPARCDAHTRQLLNESWLSLPDAVSLQWATAYLYGGRRSLRRAIGLAIGILLRPRTITTQIPERFGGVTFTWLLLETAVQRGLRVYLIGSPQGSDITATAATIQRQLPKLKLIGTWPGELAGKQGTALLETLRRQPIERELVADLRAKNPGLILVGMGFPLQEELMAKLATQLPHGVLVGEGGSFDYTSFGGRRRKAPRVMQVSGLEWLWRLCLEPGRIGRQLAIPRFMRAVYRSGKQKA